MISSRYQPQQARCARSWADQVVVETQGHRMTRETSGRGPRPNEYFQWQASVDSLRIASASETELLESVGQGLVLLGSCKRKKERKKVE